MKTKNATKTLIVITIILLAGGTIAFAHGGWGYGGDGPRTRGYGECDGGSKRGYGPGCEYGRWGGSELTKEEVARLEQEREKFYTDTKDLRRQIRDLKVDLRDEMAKEAPDRDSILKFQKSLSKMEADFDQKAIEHRLEMQKIAPENFKGRGRGRGFGPGYGRGKGKGFDRGYGRGGGCRR